MKIETVSFQIAKGLFFLFASKEKTLIKKMLKRY